MEILQVLNTATASTVSWTADKDYDLVGCTTTGPDGVVSFDPTMTYAIFIATPTVKQVQLKIGFLVSGVQYGFQLKIPIDRGRKIFVATNNVAGTISIYLEPRLITEI